MSGLFEWRLEAMERGIDEALRIKYEVAALRSDVDRLERTVGELRSENDGLRIELQAVQDQINALTEVEE